jgi:preprotein translocase subunit SecA
LLILAEKLSELDTCIQQLGEPEIKNREVLMIAAEHHPLKEGDEVLFSFMSRLTCRSRIRFHCALDEPLFKLFGGERVSSLLKNLGWKEKDHISHSVISSAIEKAQEKVKQKARGNQRVDSVEDWFHYNATTPL